MPDTAWYDDPDLQKLIIQLAGQYASSRSQKKGDIQFKTQPETAAELAYRKYAEGLAGMNGKPGPTYSYLAPKIDANLRTIASNSAAYTPLNRLDATGKEIPRTATAPPPIDFSSWTNPLTPGGTAPGTPSPFGSGPNAPTNSIGSGRPGEGGPIQISHSDLTTDGGPPIGVGRMYDPRDINQPGSILGSDPTRGGTGMPDGMSRGSISLPDMAAMRGFVSQYGKAAGEIAFAIYTANPLLGMKGAIDAYNAWRNGGPKPPGVPAGTLPPGVGPNPTGGV